MKQNFQKNRYGHNIGCYVHHTTGSYAGESTLRYMHSSSELIFMYFIHGTGHIIIEGHRYNIEKGNIFLLRPGELFHCAIDDGQYHERIVLHVTNSILANFSCNTDTFLSPFYQYEKGFENCILAPSVSVHGLDSDLRTILDLLKDGSNTNQLLATCKVIEFLAKTADISKTSQTQVKPLIADVLAFLNTHFRENISIAEIASKINIDSSYLSHIFREQVGISLWKYVIYRRIYFCNEMIRKNFSIEESCYQAGFQNYSNFYRLYKKYMGMTPMEFKKNYNHKKN